VFHPAWGPAWVPDIILFIFLSYLFTRLIRSNETRIHVGLRLRLWTTVVCLLASVSARAEEPAPQNAGPDQTQSGVATLPTVTVQEKALDSARARITPNLGATTYTLDSEKIDSQSQGEFASFDQTFYRFPGVVQDELDKRLHVRGEEANLQYRINGLLLPDGLSGFGQELSTKFLDSVSLITGILPAQYGDRTAGIVDIRTKSGQELQGGSISLYGGDYHTVTPIIEYGGSSGPFSGYGLFSYMHDSIGMANPNAGYRAMHDDTDQFKAFGNFSYLIDNTSRLTLILSAAHSTFELPTTAGQTPQFPFGPITFYDSSRVNENQYEQAYYEILGYQKSFGDIDLQLTQSFRYSDVSFNPDTVADVIFNGIASDADHTLISNNFQCDASYRVSDRHTVRSGLSFIVQQAVVNTLNSVLPVIPGGYGDPTVIPDDYHKTAELYGAYLQDEWRIIPEFTVNYGLRADLWAAYINEAQISPRVNFVYKPIPSTTLHAGYGRYFTPPPLELVQAGDIAKFNGTTNAVDPTLLPTTAIAVQSERYHYFDVGINHDITPHFHVGVDAYYKIKKNVLDEGQFGPAMIFSPNNAAKGLVRGVEFTVSYEKDGIAAWGNFARSQATAKGLTSGQWQFSPDDVAYMQTHWFHLDHDQDWTASAGGSYKWGNTKVYADALYGSGLYGGLTDDSELPSYVTVNLGMTHEFVLGPGNIIKLRFDVINVGDVKYEIREGNGIGVFAPQYLPRRAIYAGITKEF